jgi:hypothetical protein
MYIRACASAALILILSSCSSAPAGPSQGTPAYYWQAAKETYAAGDYLKTLDHLDRILAGQNEFRARALPWSMVLTSGMAGGYAEMAEHFSIGARVNKADPGSFRRQVSDCRAFANRLGLQFAETFAKMDPKDESIPLAFGFPRGTAAPAPVMTKVANGILLTPDELGTAQKRSIERGVIRAACRAAGAPDDSARTEAILKEPDAKVPRATFVVAMAQTLYDQSQLYTRDRLDDPQKMELFCQRAQDALKSVPESKESKDLSAKIQSTLKKTKKS